MLVIAIFRLWCWQSPQGRLWEPEETGCMALRFFITLLPTLPLVTHFLPYYLFLPVIGLSRLELASPGCAIASVVCTGGCCSYSRIHSAGVLAVTSRSIRKDIGQSPVRRVVHSRIRNASIETLLSLA
jgi:hypothetical protein